MNATILGTILSLLLAGATARNSTGNNAPTRAAGASRPESESQRDVCSRPGERPNAECFGWVAYTRPVGGNRIGFDPAFTNRRRLLANGLRRKP